MILWNYLVPPLAGLVIGYFTNDLAIKMLFRPYRPYRLWGRQLPFTPGLIPQNQPRLARQIAQTIMGSLLTPEELHNLARKLLKTERMQAGIHWFLHSTLERLEHPEQQQKTAEVLSHILADLFKESLPRLIRIWSRQEDFLEDQINQLFDQVLLDIRFTDQQSEQLANWILEQALPPKVLRLSLVDFLTDRNIDAIDEELKGRSTGPYWVFANFLGAKGALQRVRSYCLDEPEAADAVLAKLLTDVGANRRLAELIQNLSLQNLPIPAIRQLRKGLRSGIQDYLRVQGSELVENFANSVDWYSLATLILGRLRGSKVVQTSLEFISLDLALILERYLDKDLESLMTQVIPILNLEQVMSDRINATSPVEMEAAIQQIVQQELQAIVNLGGILGLLVGCLQSGILFLQH
jgi:uncharacterized membrane protein YheB (UPF0754 family)